MHKSVKTLIILLLHLLSARFCSASEPLPNDSENIAQLFGMSSSLSAETDIAVPVWSVSDERTFHVLNISEGIIKDCTAKVFLITDSIVFWLDSDETIQIPAYMTDALKNFDSSQLMMLRDTFGTENNPGIDNDSRFHVLFTDKIGVNYNGYFSSADTVDSEIRISSNGMELLFLNTRLLTQGGAAVIDTLAHEYQHMIHFNYDPNEYSFINEGLSCLAEYLALGITPEIFIRNYLSDTGKSLIWWPDSGMNYPYYGSAFLFCVYLYDRFGTDFIKELVNNPANGLDGVDSALKHLNIPYTANEVFQQWTAALIGKLVQEPVGNWGYHGFYFPQQGIYRDIRTLSCGEPELREVPQYGIRFFNSSCAGSFRITVEGLAENTITSLQIPAGDSAWWSGAVSNSISMLSREFDLSAADTPVRLEYDVNYDIEDHFDYYYLLLTDDSGTVTRLSPSTSTMDDPVHQNLGNGTTGGSDGVIHEVIDLDQWAGQKIRITFAYVTDTATVSDGLLLDDIQIEAIGFMDDAESEVGLWEATGFTRIHDSVPQTFSLTVLQPQPYGNVTEFYTFKGGEPVIVNCPEENCIFAVSAIDRGVRSRASFTVHTDPLSY